MRGREGDDFPHAGPWNCEFSSGSAAFVEHDLSTGARALSTFGRQSVARDSFLLDRCAGFKAV